MRIGSLWLSCLLLLAPAAQAKTSEYDVTYTIGFEPAQGEAIVSIAIEQREQARVSRLVFDMPEARYSAIEGDGKISRTGGKLAWEPPTKGGELRYRYRIDHSRSNGAFDARIAKDFAIVRGDDLVPSASVKATKGADSRARLRLELPPGWPHADTPWKLAKDGKSYVVVNAERSFDRPTGWIIAGDIGVRRDVVEGMEIAVGAPKGEPMPRMQILSMLTATAPAMREAFGTLPPKLLIVGAGDPMWRGGLSGPRSLWMHAERPLISENGSSTLMHETVHVVTRIRGAKGEDWIAEGFAEYYGIELMRRAGLLSEARFDKTIGWMRKHGRKVKTLRADSSAGPRTARAVAMLNDLDAEIRQHAPNRSLDDVARSLMGRGRVSSEDLRTEAQAVIGAPSKVLQSAQPD